ncbi:MAG: hypothetical protein AB8F78_17965 [Saprospiraceae bacterium]
MNFISRLQKLLPNKTIDVDKVKNTIIVKNINNSSIFIYPFDKDDLEQLRNDIHKDQLNIFDNLVHEIVASFTVKIKHFSSIPELKTSTKNHQFLFKNNLAFFTREEIDAHFEIVCNIQEFRTALLIGLPATGKSIAVIDIADKLAISGFKTYYYSFKKIHHWPDIWSEIKNHADTKTVFVLDDIHLHPEIAGTTLNRLIHNDDLNILFISREIYKNRNYAGTLNIYKELSSTTVRTDKPNIDEKVKGIVGLYQSFYKKTIQGSFLIGSFFQINKNVHKNLIVLSAYLRLWLKYPESKLSELQESELYKDIYVEYFIDSTIDEDTRLTLLQYLCIYYFEIEFYQNPKEKNSTRYLLERAAINKNRGDLYSIYHGEYAFLLLKAFRFSEKKQFKRLGGSWIEFFINLIKIYLLGFKEASNYFYPDNLLDILTLIPRFTKEVHGGMKNTNIVFKRIVEEPELQSLILQCCNEEEEFKNIYLFLISILKYSPRQFEFFFKGFGEDIFKEKKILGIYCAAYKTFFNQNELSWFEIYCSSHLQEMLQNSSITSFGHSLSTLSKFHPKKAKSLYSIANSALIISKAKISRISEVGRALNELKNIDRVKTKKIFEVIEEDHFKKMIANARIHEIGNALNELKNIDPAKTKKIFEAIEEDHFKRMIANARINEVGSALNELKNIDPAKTKKIFEAIEEDHFKKMIANARISEVGSALNELKNIDPAKTKKIFEAIEENHIKRMIANARINEVGSALIRLKKIDPEKTIKICENSKEYILIKIQSSKQKYRSFIEVINLLSRASKSLGVSIYQLVSKEKLYQFNQLQNIYSFNLFAQYLLNIELNFQDEKFLELMDFGLKKSGTFLKYTDTSIVGTYIGIMFKLNQNIDNQIAINKNRYTIAVLNDNNHEIVPRLIANIFMHSEELAIETLLASYQNSFPNNNIIVARVYLEIAKNNLQSDNLKISESFIDKIKLVAKVSTDLIAKKKICSLIDEYDLVFHLALAIALCITI